MQTLNFGISILLICAHSLALSGEATSQSLQRRGYKRLSPPPQRPKPAKVKTDVTGPAAILDRDRIPIHRLEPGEKYKYTERDPARAKFRVDLHDGNPPGQATMSVRGNSEVNVYMDIPRGRQGLVTEGSKRRPGDQTVIEGGHDRAIFKHADNTGVRPKLRAELQGPGIMQGSARNYLTDEDRSTIRA